MIVKDENIYRYPPGALQMKSRTKTYILICMLGGLTAIATLELFTQNYFKYGRISFTMRQRIKF